MRKALASVDPNLVLYGVDPYAKVVSADFQQENMIATLTMLFGVLGLVLAAVGLYGVLAYMVERRTGEIGVRMALGADRGRVMAMVLRGAFWQVGVGLALGLPAAIGAGKLMTSSTIWREAVGPAHAGVRYVAARPGRPGGFHDSCLARGGRRADGGAPVRVTRRTGRHSE